MPESDHVTSIKYLKLESEVIKQNILGINWDYKTDCFKFEISSFDQGITKRGCRSKILVQTLKSRARANIK